VVEQSFQGSRAPAGQKEERLPFSYVVHADALTRIDTLYHFYLKENILFFHKTT
jgi:hypothetical protein